MTTKTIFATTLIVIFVLIVISASTLPANQNITITTSERAPLDRWGRIWISLNQLDFDQAYNSQIRTNPNDQFTAVVNATNWQRYRAEGNFADMLLELQSTEPELYNYLAEKYGFWVNPNPFPFN